MFTLYNYSRLKDQLLAAFLPGDSTGNTYNTTDKEDATFGCSLIHSGKLCMFDLANIRVNMEVL